MYFLDMTAYPLPNFSCSLTKVPRVICQYVQRNQTAEWRLCLIIFRSLVLCRQIVAPVNMLYLVHFIIYICKVFWQYYKFLMDSYYPFFISLTGFIKECCCSVISPSVITPSQLVVHKSRTTDNGIKGNNLHWSRIIVPNVGRNNVIVRLNGYWVCLVLDGLRGNNLQE